MKRALISAIEPREGGFRVAQAVAVGEEFPVATGMEWADCDDAVVPDKFYFKDGAFVAIPEVTPNFILGLSAAPNQPVVTGANEL